MRPGAATNGELVLENGERLTQREFHRRYQHYPEHVKFELVGGTVYMASPARFDHGDFDGELAFVLRTYKAATPGVRVAGKVTVILGPDDEPQPDQVALIMPEFGGQCTIDRRGYCRGAPEFVSEVAWSERSLEVSEKRDRYERAGVSEYFVFVIETGEVRWHDFDQGREIAPGRNGVGRSNVLPGLWIDIPALRDRDTARLTSAVEKGLASPEHARFVRRLRAARRST
jgi:hypothetical protein